MLKEHLYSMRRYSKYLKLLVVIALVIVTSHWWFSRSDSPRFRDVDWWEHATFYQVYVRSFKDSDGDGIGDLRGLLLKLDYLVDLGVEVVWLSSIFPSPMVDSGYDVTDYYDVHYVYGAVDDVVKLTEAAHDLGLKVIMDLVPNHASIDSKYFIRSVEREQGYDTFFIWADPKPGTGQRTEPSNWISYHGGSAWEWNDQRQQYYLHNYDTSEADFNFRNPTVRQELLNIYRFWLEKGIDGFHLIGLKNLLEINPEEYGGYPDEPVHTCKNGNLSAGSYAKPLFRENQKETLDLIYEWRRFFENWQAELGGNTILMTAVTNDVKSSIQYYDCQGSHNGLHFPLNLVLVDSFAEDFNAQSLVLKILTWLVYMPNGCSANWMLGNQDISRIATRFGDQMVDGFNSLLLLLPGVAITYQGEELGMRDGHIRRENMKDDRTLQHMVSRDPGRTPFHWDGTNNAGFSVSLVTWLPVAHDYQSINVKAQRESEWSHLKIYKTLTRLRKEPTLTHGDWHVEALSNNIMVLVRHLESFPTFVLIFNVGTSRDVADLTRVKWAEEPATVVVSSLLASQKIGESISLKRINLASGDSLVIKTAPT